jgi:hypothetical protein
MSVISCVAFQHLEKGALRGFAVIDIASWGLRIHGMSFFEKDGSRWINLPSKKTSKPGTADSWMPVIEFTSKEARASFTGECVAAIQKFIASHPRSEAAR